MCFYSKGYTCLFQEQFKTNADIIPFPPIAREMNMTEFTLAEIAGEMGVSGGR